MLEVAILNNKVPPTKNKSLLSLCGYLWMTNEIKTIDPKETKRLNRYKRITANHLAVETPAIIKEDHFVACLEDRLHGSLLIDKKIKFITFEEFLENSSRMDGYDEDRASPVYKEIAHTVFDTSRPDFIDMVSNPDNLSKKAIYWLTKNQNKEWVILYDYIENKFEFNDMVQMIFREYDFEQVSMDYYEYSDEQYPEYDDIVNGNCYHGEVTLKDIALVEKEIKFKFVNLRVLANSLN